MQTKVIKKYANRKLYDTQKHVYVNLDRIKEFAVTGVEFMVVDNKTKEDITNETLKQVVFQNKDFTTSELMNWLKL